MEAVDDPDNDTGKPNGPDMAAAPASQEMKCGEARLRDRL